MRGMYTTKGVALITVLLIISIGTFISVSMISRQQLNVHRSANIFGYEQSFQYLLAAESFAVKFLKEDWDEDKKNDQHDYVADLKTDKSEVWSGFHKVYPLVPFESVNLSACIEDMHGRFNINNLSTGSVEYRKQFERLLTSNDLNADLADAVIDWFDNNSTPELHGAEDDYYFEYNYRTAEAPMQNLSELAFIKGYSDTIDKLSVTGERVKIPVWKILMPYLSDIPDINTTLNMNTASETVLESVDGISASHAKTLTVSGPYNEVASEMNKLSITLPTGTSSLPGYHGLSVDSQYFQLNTFITPRQYPDNVVSFQSVFYRDPATGDVVLKRRSRGIVDPVNRDFNGKCLGV